MDDNQNWRYKLHTLQIATAGQAVTISELVI